MDIRFLIVGAPFIIAFLYTIFWLKRWGAFNSPDENFPKKMALRNQTIEQIYFLENIFLKKN